MISSWNSQGHSTGKGRKPLFEMCWFYMGKGIAQIALDPPPLSNGQTILASPYTPSQNWGKKVLQTILASPYAPTQMWERSAPNHPRRPLHPPLQTMPIWKQQISKRGFPYKSGFSNLRAMWYFDLAASTNHPWQEEAGALCQQQFKYFISEDFRNGFSNINTLGSVSNIFFWGSVKILYIWAQF